MSLSVDDRLELVEELWASISSEAEHWPLTSDQKELLSERLDAYRKDPDAGHSWEEVEQRLRARLRETRKT